MSKVFLDNFTQKDIINVALFNKEEVMLSFDNIKDNKEVYRNLIGGFWEESASGKLIPINSPMDDSLLGHIQAVTKDEIDCIYSNSKKAFDSWKHTSLKERADIMHKAADILEKDSDTIARIMSKEICKDYKSSYNEVIRTVDFIRYAAEEGLRVNGEVLNGGSFMSNAKNKMALVTREPYGVVLSITPFNYPISLSASKIAPALMGGNVVLYKPSTQGALCCLHLIEVFRAAGVPEGVINTVTGDVSEIGDYLVEHKDVDFINFTGSTAVGKHIASKAGIVPTIMELGGKDAGIVLSDADIPKAASRIVVGAFGFSGQRCTAIKRVVVMEDVADELVGLIKKEVEKLKVGMPFDEGVTVTPVINNRSAEFIQGLMDDAVAKGATLIMGNKREKNLIYPTIFDHVTEDMRLAWEEPFGPLLPIIRVKSLEEAIEISNRSEYGLQAAVFTQNMEKAIGVARRLEVGTVHINNKTQRGPDHFPFLGAKASGVGAQGVRYSIEGMTRIKSTVIDFDDSF